MKTGAKASYKSSRRQFLLHSTVAIISSSISPLASASYTDVLIRSKEKHLSFKHLHTNEVLQCCYRKDDQYNFQAIAEINHILRDHRTNEVFAIDHQLLEMLHRLHTMTNSSMPFEIISGFRSLATNEKLRKSSTGVAKRSYHMQGKAIDVRLADVDLTTLRDTAISLQAGGVGYYRKSGFLHLDTGKPRNW